MAKSGLTRRAVIGAASAAGALSLCPALAPAQVEAASGPAAFEGLFHLDVAQAGSGNHRWAMIIAGEVTGGAVRGSVRSGRLDWHVDPATGTAEAMLACGVCQADGVENTLRQTKLAAVRLEGGVVLLRAIPQA